MSAQDILGQDEIDALINGAKQDAAAPPPAEGEASNYDFGRSARIVRGRMPTLEIFFGGKGRHAKIEGREFSAIENNIVRTLLMTACENIRDAWSHIVRLRLEVTGSEINPHFANIVGPTEIVVVSTFKIEVDDQGGDFQISLPYSMIEPLREILESGMQSDRAEHDDRWTQALRAEIEDAGIEVRATLGRATLKLSDVLNLPSCRPCLGNCRNEQRARTPEPLYSQDTPFHG